MMEPEMIEMGKAVVYSLGVVGAVYAASAHWLAARRAALEPQVIAARGTAAKELIESDAYQHYGDTVRELLTNSNFQAYVELRRTYMDALRDDPTINTEEIPRLVNTAYGDLEKIFSLGHLDRSLEELLPK